MLTYLVPLVALGPQLILLSLAGVSSISPAVLGVAVFSTAVGCAGSSGGALVPVRGLGAPAEAEGNGRFENRRQRDGDGQREERAGERGGSRGGGGAERGRA